LTLIVTFTILLCMSSTEENKKKDFDSQLGSKAIVEHHQIENDQYTHQLREVLADMGDDLQKSGKVPKGMQYQGSFSVHVYASPILRTFAFAGVNNPGTCHGQLAEAAGMKLNQDIREYFHGKRQKKRSGF